MRKFVQRNYYVYIITNTRNTVFYIGVTNNVERRLWEHKNKYNPNSFSARYCLQKLVYYEDFTDVYSAIAREKQLKRWHRPWKIDLIKKENPNFEDLSATWN
ncbi:GIY-YIG nuclease family protein [Patescibacteria group bacterium]|nr:GIY-YIG nuclease family protein [Patescibacteria group bacterium]